MSLPHNIYFNSTSISECIKNAFANPSNEVNLAVSDLFFDYEGDPSVPDKYQAFFEEKVSEAKAVLGDPIYQGRFDSPRFGEFAVILPDGIYAMELAVWEEDGKRFYIQINWEDTELPIIISMGVEGCERSYDGLD